MGAADAAVDAEVGAAPGAGMSPVADRALGDALDSTSHGAVADLVTAAEADVTPAFDLASDFDLGVGFDLGAEIDLYADLDLDPRKRYGDAYDRRGAGAFAGDPLDAAAPREAVTPPRAPWGMGPLRLHDPHALALTRLTLAAASPRIVAPGHGEVSLRLHWGQSITHHEEAFTVDAETVDLLVGVRVGVTDRVELSLEMPATHRWEGLLDPFVRNVEDTFSHVRPERRDLPDGEYGIRGTTSSGERFDLARGTGLGKLRFGVKALLLGSALEPFAVSGEVVLGLPTGSSGFATEGVDVGVRLAAAYRFGDIILYGGASLVFTPGGLGPIEMRPLKASGFAAGEVELTPWLSFVYQGWVESPTTRNLREDGGTIVLHGGGLVARFGQVVIEGGVLENGCDVRISADVAFYAGLRVEF